MTRSQPTSPSAALLRSLLPLALGACATSQGDGGGPGDLGRVPLALVELYDRASPQGVVELEIDRDGAIREMEADVPIEALPQSVLAAARERYPDARIVGGEREITKQGAGWEVKLQHQGRDMELVFSDSGELLEVERAIDRSEAPSAVMQAAERAIPGGRLKSVEVIEQGGAELYHVKLERDGASYKVVVTPEGRVARRVREQRAEIEIPLKEELGRVLRLGYVGGQAEE